jgi:hypothetical protein
MRNARAGGVSRRERVEVHCGRGSHRP